MNDMRTFAATAVAALALAGCKVEPTFTDIQEKIFLRSCMTQSGCHEADAPDPGGGLVLEGPTAYDELLGMAEGDQTTNVMPVDRFRVIPGDPELPDRPGEGSYIMDKLD